MTEVTKTKRKPSLILRLFLIILILAGIFAALGYTKFTQIQVMIEQGSAAPPPISVTVATAKTDSWYRNIKAIGTLVANQRVNITSEVAGIIESINFESGDEVKERSLLIELDNRSEMASLESTRAQFNADNSQYQRLLKLQDQSFVTSNDVDSQASLVDVSRARVSVAKTALAKRRVYAPFSGKLGIRQVDEGEYITPGKMVVRLQSLDKLLLDFTLPEGNYNDLALNQSITFQVRAYPETSFTAKVQAWNPDLDPNTRTISVRAEVNNQKRLLAPGMFAEMTIQSKQKIPVLKLPETSIFYNIYGQAVYVLETEEGDDEQDNPEYRLAARQVEVAYRQDNQVGVTSGIKEGDLVVTSGQLKLYPSLSVAIVDDVPDYSAPGSN